MSLRNSADRYGSVAMVLHWLTVAAIVATVPLAWWMDDLEPGLDKLWAYGVHKSIGMTVLAVTVLRLVWRLANPRPRFLGASRWQHGLSRLVHAGLYAVLIALPLVGWLHSAAVGFPVRVWGLVTLPAPIGPDRPLAETLLNAHGALASALLALLALHVAGALKHHLVDRDDTLRRMLPGTGRHGT